MQMQLVKEVIEEQYDGSTRKCEKLTGKHTAQLYRWIKSGAMVDGNDDVWIKSGKFSRESKS